MEQAVSTYIKPSLSIIRAVLYRILSAALVFVGATDETAKWWRAVFERKVLTGKVGVPLRWSSNTEADVLWELEGLVESLSREDLTQAFALKKFSGAPSHTTGLSDYISKSGQDCSLNNPWMHANSQFNNSWREASGFLGGEGTTFRHRSKSSSGIRKTSGGNQNQPLSKFCDTSTHASPTLDEAIITFHEENVSFSDDAGDSVYLDSFEHTLDPCNTENEYHDTRQLCRRSVSNPDLLLCRDDSFASDNIFFALTPSMSEPSIYLGNEDRETRGTCITKTDPQFPSAIQTAPTESHYQCPQTNAAEEVEFAKPYRQELEKIDTIRRQTSSSGDISLILDTDEPTGSCYGNYQHPYSRMLQLNDNRNNNDDPANGSSDAGPQAHSTSGDAGKARTTDASTIPFLKMQENKHDNTQGDRSTFSEEIFSDVRRSSVDPCRTGQSETNQNALDSNVDGTGTTVFGSEVDPQPGRFPRPSHCPIPGCSQSDCILDNRRQSSLADFPPLRPNKFVDVAREVTAELRRKFLYDDEPMPSVHPLKKAAKLDPNRGRLRFSRIGEMIPSADKDRSKILDTMKFDVTRKPQMEPPNPLELVKNVLGLGEATHHNRPHSDTLSPTGPLKHTKTPRCLGIRQFYAWLTCNDDTENQEEVTATRSSRYYTRPKLPPPTHYLTGYSAYKYYRLLTRIEVLDKITDLREEREKMLNYYKWKQEILMDVVKIARDYYSDPTDTNLWRWKSLKKSLPAAHQSNTDVRVHVSKLPDHWPVFTVFLMLIQVVSLIVTGTVHGFAKQGIDTLVDVHTSVVTIMGTETLKFMHEPNPWIGPQEQSLIMAGAVISSCMRPNERLRSSTHRKGYMALTEETISYFGCCEMSGRINRAGTTSIRECSHITEAQGKWREGVLCSSRKGKLSSVAHVIRPCCIGFQGRCEMLSHEQCNHYRGSFHVECDHCVQVSCLSSICSYNVVADEMAPWLPGQETQWQWWRFVWSIPITFGFLHWFALLPVHLLMMIPLERHAGWHRVVILYSLSSLVGLMVASIILPGLPHVGATEGAAGVLGVAILELFQAWRYVRWPVWEAVKLGLLILFYIILGTFHLVSVFGFVSGLLVGMLACLMIIPYITFGRRLGRHRLLLVLIGFIFLVPLLALINFLWRFPPSYAECKSCLLLECIPYTDSMCKTYVNEYNMHPNLYVYTDLL